MKKIIPAILTKDFGELEQRLESLHGVTDWVQVDIMDGKFVDNTTIGVEEISRVKNAGNFLLEAHLMVQNPADYFESCQKAGFKRVVFHFEGVSNMKKVLAEAATFSFEKGLALNPETLIQEAMPYAAELDVILLMSVNPGFGGQAFIPGVLDKIKELREAAPHIKIEVDGGINLENIKAISDAGADYLVVGKSLFSAQDIKERFKELISKTS